MNIFNKNIIRRRISIFLLLMLYLGLCFEVAAFPPDVMAVGEFHELDWRCSSEVVEIDVERGEALFVLHKEGRALDEEIFHFETTLDSVFSGADAKIVQLTDCDCELKGGSYGNDD